VGDPEVAKRADDDVTDAQMLAQFVQSRSPEAFAQVVARHVHLVYSACLRQLRDPVLADQATQGVFTLLARQAARLNPGAGLAPWLFDVAYRTCRAAQALAPTPPGDAAAQLHATPTDWQALAPHIDEAIVSLPDGAREAFLLKYVADRPLREVAEALGVSDRAAGQRIAAGVAKLRKWLESRRNQFVAPEALVAAVQARSVQPAPASAAYNATLAAVAPADVPSPAAGLAETVAGAMRRERVTSIAVMAAVVLLLAVGVFRLYGAVRAARLAAATQPSAATEPSGDQAAPSTTQQQQGGPTRGMQNLPPVGDKQLPAIKPIKPVDPALAARFVQAIRQSDFDAVQAMIDNDEDLVNAVDPRSGRAAVEIAADLVLWRRQDATRIAHFLIENGAATGIHTSARAGHTRHVALMLALRPDLLNAKDEQGLTPLQRAALVPGASPEAEEVAELLMEVGATVDVWTACTFGRFDDVKAALEKDPSLINKPCLGGTPLNWAARPRKYSDDPLAIPRLLIERGADVRSRDMAQDGMTPLHHAAAWGAGEAVAGLLLEKGVDVNIADDYAWTPLDYAIDKGRTEMAEFLKAKGGRRTTVDPPANQPLKTARFFAAVEFNDAELTKKLLDDTPELARTRGPTGETPMHWAAANGATKIIDDLLIDHADVNAQETNKYGGTPLHWAVKHDRVEAVKHLLAKGADPKLVNLRSGQTLLHVAAQHTDDAALVDWLLSLGIDPAARDRFGKTAANYAKAAGHAAVAKRLARPGEIKK
jgi:RNA polymerase sigma factor (sigma-70 family)